MASVNSYFQPYSPVTQESVASAINTAIKNATNCGTADCGILAGAQYTGVYLEKIQYCCMNRMKQECFNFHNELYHSL